MELYRTSQAFSRLSFLASTTRRQCTQSIAPRARHCIGQGQRPQTQASRAFSTTTFLQKPISDELSEIFNSTLDQKKGTPTAPTGRTSTFKSRYAQQQDSRELANEMRAAKSSSHSEIDFLLDGMVTKNKPSNRKRSRFDRVTDTFESAATREEPLQLPKNVGRLVEVDEARGIDVARAYKSMETRLIKNQVRLHVRLQRFHERPGLKRKRLKRERWAKRFKANFTGVVQMVQKMKKQGW